MTSFMSPAPRRFEMRRRIHFVHCDPAAIVFYPQYLVMLNELIEDWFTDGMGIPYGEVITGRRWGLPTVKLECEFKAVSRMNDEIIQSLALERLGQRSFTALVEYRGADAARELRVSIRVVIVLTRLDTHRSMDIPPELRQAMARYLLDPAAVAAQ